MLSVIKTVVIISFGFLFLVALKYAFEHCYSLMRHKKLTFTHEGQAEPYRVLILGEDNREIFFSVAGDFTILAIFAGFILTGAWL